MALSLRMSWLRCSPIHQVIKHSFTVPPIPKPRGLFSSQALVHNYKASFTMQWRQALKQLQENKLRRGCTFALAFSPIGIYSALHSANFNSFCEHLKAHIPSSFMANCAEPCYPCGPHAQLCEHGVLIKPPSCKEKTRQTWRDSLLYIADSVFKHVLLFIQLVKLCILFGPVMIFYPLTSYHCKLYQLWLYFMYKAVQWSGPVYVKLGQWAGTRRDLFCPTFCEYFSQLHSNTRPHSWNETEQILRRSYGKRWRDTIKLDQNQEPVGSGCVAQVYRGFIRRHFASLPSCICDCVTKDEDYYKDERCRGMTPINLPYRDEFINQQLQDGLEIRGLSDTFGYSADDYDDQPECYIAYPPNCGCLYENDPNYLPVAVKVLHPCIRERFALDLNLINKVATVMQFFMPSLRWVNLKECVKEFSITMARQMDLLHEARALKRLNDDFCGNPNVAFPLPVMSLVCRDVLIESFEEGKPVSDFLNGQQGRDYRNQCLRNKISEIAINTLLQMVFIKNFVHGDLHPGNILVQNSDCYQSQLKSACGPMCGTACSCVCRVISGPLDGTGQCNTHDITFIAPHTDHVYKNPCPLRLVMVDVGITATLNCEDLKKFRELVTAIVKGQGYAVADMFLEKSNCGECSTPCEFRHAMACLVERLHGANNRLCKARVSDLLGDFYRILTYHKVRLESNFSRVVLAVGILEGLGRSLNPELDIIGKTCDILLQCN